MVQDDGGRVTPSCVSKIRSPLRPDVGKSWTLSQRMGEPPLDETVSHGKPSRSSESVRAQEDMVLCFLFCFFNADKLFIVLWHTEVNFNLWNYYNQI